MCHSVLFYRDQFIHRLFVILDWNSRSSIRRMDSCRLVVKSGR